MSAICKKRTLEFQERMREADIDVMLLMDPDSIYYFTAFWGDLGVEFGRPSIVVIPRNDEPIVITSSIEGEMCRRMTWISQITLYHDSVAYGWQYFFGKDFNILRAENGFIQYQDQFGEIILPEPNVLGEHNLWNISTAIAASRKLFNVKDEHIKKGITSIRLKGRLEKIKSGKLVTAASGKEIYVDIASNVNAARAIASWINSFDQNIQFHIILGFMFDKDHIGFVSTLNTSEKVKSFSLIDIPDERGSITKEDLKQKLKNINKDIKTRENVFDAIKTLKIQSTDKILITGSAYLVGKVLNLN